MQAEVSLVCHNLEYNVHLWQNADRINFNFRVRVTINTVRVGIRIGVWVRIRVGDMVRCMTTDHHGKPICFLEITAFKACGIHP